MLNISLTVEVLGWGELSTETNILLVLIATGRWFDLVSLFNGISTFLGYLMPIS